MPDFEDYAGFKKTQGSEKFERYKLTTNRLVLIAATCDHINAELESNAKLAMLLNAEISSNWPPGEYDRNAQEYFKARLEDGGLPVSGWYVWYALLPETPDRPSTLIGSAGYFGPPTPKGDVEIGFSVMGKWQNKGYATEIAKALIANAFRDNRTFKVVAHALPDNLPSCRVLMKCGFHYVGIDEESGYNRFEILRP